MEESKRVVAELSVYPLYEHVDDTTTTRPRFAMSEYCDEYWSSIFSLESQRVSLMFLSSGPSWTQVTAAKGSQPQRSRLDGRCS